MKISQTAGWMFALVLALAACAPAELVEPESEIVGAERPTMANPPEMPRLSAPPSAPPESRILEIPVGASLTFALIDSLSTDGNRQGDTFQASLAEAVVIDGRTVMPRNMPASGRVLAVDEGGRVSGRARIELIMISVQAGRQTVALETVPFVAVADSSAGRDAATIGGGAGIGAAIGGILDGRRGGIIGGAIGGGSGTAVVLATRGNQIELPPETQIVFMLSEPLRITDVVPHD